MGVCVCVWAAAAREGGRTGLCVALVSPTKGWWRAEPLSNGTGLGRLYLRTVGQRHCLQPRAQWRRRATAVSLATGAVETQGNGTVLQRAALCRPEVTHPEVLARADRSRHRRVVLQRQPTSAAGSLMKERLE